MLRLLTTAMSRVGKLPISIPSGVTVTMDEKSSIVTVKGPKGELKQHIHPDISVAIENGVITFSRPTDQKRHRSMHGLYRVLVNNMITGVSSGFEKKLEVIGVGFKAEATGQQLELSVGHSHPILMILPKEVSVATETKRGSAPVITLNSIDKQLIGQVAAKIREMRPPEPYKGKGIRRVGEFVRRKAGKTGGKGKK